MMIQMAESGWPPDGLVRFGIRRLLARRLLQEQQQQQTNTEVLTTAPVAVIRMPRMSSTTRWMPGFTSRCWGPHLKYSSGYWPADDTDLAQAEAAMLALTCERAQLAPGQDIPLSSDAVGAR